MTHEEQQKLIGDLADERNKYKAALTSILNMVVEGPDAPSPDSQYSNGDIGVLLSKIEEDYKKSQHFYTKFHELARHVLLKDTTKTDDSLFTSLWNVFDSLKRDLRATEDAGLDIRKKNVELLAHNKNLLEHNDVLVEEKNKAQGEVLRLQNLEPHWHEKDQTTHYTDHHGGSLCSSNLASPSNLSRTEDIRLVSCSTCLKEWQKDYKPSEPQAQQDNEWDRGQRLYKTLKDLAQEHNVAILVLP